MAQLVIVSILFFMVCVLPALHSDVLCPRGTFLNASPIECTKCPDKTFMDADNHTNKECKKCRRIYEYNNNNIAEQLNCTATHDLFLKCTQKYYVYPEDSITVECMECKHCSNGNSSEILPCNGINDTFCCPRDDMVAELNEKGTYTCVVNKRSSSAATTTPTSAAEGSMTTIKDVATSYDSRTTERVTTPIIKGSALSTQAILGIVVAAVFFVAVVVIILGICYYKQYCCFAREYRSPGSQSKGTPNKEEKVMMTHEDSHQL